MPISIANASRLSTITLTLTYDPALLRSRTVQEGSFMRSGGANATFTQQVGHGRVDITIIRAADCDRRHRHRPARRGAVRRDRAGSVDDRLSGTATGPGGTAMGLQFRPVTVTIQP